MDLKTSLCVEHINISERTLQPVILLYGRNIKELINEVSDFIGHHSFEYLSSCIITNYPCANGSRRIIPFADFVVEIVGEWLERNTCMDDYSKCEVTSLLEEQLKQPCRRIARRFQ